MYSIFEKLLEQHKVTAYRVAKETGINTATLTSWKQGKYAPKPDKLQKIADYFGVSLEYLMTGEEKKAIDAGAVEELDGVYLSLAREAQQSGIDPDDVRVIIETIKSIKRARGE